MVALNEREKQIFVITTDTEVSDSGLVQIILFVLDQ